MDKTERFWCRIALLALGIAGAYALAPLLLRLPLSLPKQWFGITLMVHVNLSVLVWMLSMAALLWTSLIPKNLRYLSHLVGYATLFGLLCIATAPLFSPDAILYKSNYIPTLHSPVFLLGLGACLMGMGVMAGMTLWAHKPFRGNPLRDSIWLSAWCYLCSLCCLLLAHARMPTIALVGDDRTLYYEWLFWGIGHGLQYLYTQLMLYVFLWGITLRENHPYLSSSYLTFLGILQALLVTLLPFGYFFYPDMSDPAHREWFTLHMRHGGGIVPLGMISIGVLGLLQKPKLSPTAETRIVSFTLLISILLFTAGGMLGYLIQGHNVTIPAHYHGSIIGITVALMGFSYCHFLKSPLPIKAIVSQIACYGGGQLAHIVGLAWMGGYGVLRKTPGTEWTMQTRIATVCFIIGGIVAIIGGMGYVYIMIRYWAKHDNQQNRSRNSS